MTSLVSKAKEYQSRGVSVIPVGSDKKPLVLWKEFQTRCATPDEIEAWWNKYPKANIGIVTGKISNLAVVDVEKGGDMTIFPETDTVATGGGGWHLYYSYVDGVENKARAYELTDVRGEGGYVVAPPSIHKSGKPYKLIKHVGRKPFPAHMFNLKPKTNWDLLMTGVPEGSRNESMAKVIGRYMNAFHPTEWETNLWPFIVWFNQKNNPPLDERELRTIWQSIGKRAVSNNTAERPVDPDEERVLPLAEVAKLYDDQQLETFSIGYEKFDTSMNGGLSNGDLVIITGQTGQGKTTFAQTISYNLAKNKIPSLWLSYEVLMKELWKKFQAMGVKEDMVAYSPMKMTSGNIDWIEGKIKEAVENYQTKVVFIDHLGFLTKKIRDVDADKNMSAYLGSICRELKSMAIEYNIAIVLLAHVRKVDGREISTDDISHSVGISQEADFVFVVKRSKEADEDENNKESAVRIVKNRRTGGRPWQTMKFDEGRLLEADLNDY